MRHRSDLNQAAIVKALRQAGALVWVIGEPCDLLVQWRAQNFLLEVKNGAKATHTTAQQERDRLGWRIDRVETVEGALQRCCGISYSKYPGPLSRGVVTRLKRTVDSQYPGPVKAARGRR